MELSSGKLSSYNFIDKVTVRGLLIYFFAFVTLLPIAGYMWLSSGCVKENCENGLATERDQAVGIGDVVYFTIVTETTLGYGDIHPHGFARVLACFQVLSGWLLAGIAIAKITSLPSRELRSVGLHAKGTWLAWNYLSSSGAGREDTVTVAEIGFEGAKPSYRGTNYTLEAKHCGQFTSHFSNAADHDLFFDYTNGNSVANDFTQGRTWLNFLESEDGKWDQYSATAKDASRIDITIKGWRATPEQCAKLKNGRPQETLTVIRDFIKTSKT